MLVDERLLDALSDVADPDLALRGLVRILDVAEDPQAQAGRLLANSELRGRLLAVLGVSAALADHLTRHPGDVEILADPDLHQKRPTASALRANLLRAVGADPDVAFPLAAVVDADLQLRIAYRRQQLRLAACDLTVDPGVDVVAAELADLAAAALDAALAIGRAELPEGAEPVRIAIIGLGKCGARELNYVSDVDVIYLAEPLPDGDETEALHSATLLAASVARACSASTQEGSLWEVDAGLRPEGGAGPLVRTLASHVAYYSKWAKTWEFQALLKARPVAGDRELGARYVADVLPLVWNASGREGFVSDVQRMRRRVEGSVPKREVDRQLKLGPGGLRDVEFSVQLLQLVHGRTDESLRHPNTLRALQSLAAGGYVGRDDAQQLDEAYRFLRTLEHRIQLLRLRRTHVVPEDEASLRRLGRSIGFRKDPVGDLTANWRRHSREVRRLHEKLFYRPLLEAVAKLDASQARLTPEAAMARMEALGYRDPAGALRHLEALTQGVSRRAAIQRTLLPVMLGWFADSADPDAGLFGFRKVSEALGTTHWYLALLRDAGATAERMARVLASSKYLTDLLLRAPEAVALLADDRDLQPRSAAELNGEMLTTVRRADEADRAVTSVRGIRRRELFRIGTAQLLGLIDVEETGQALTAVAEAVVSAGLEAALLSVARQRGAPTTRISVIAMGRFGGGELGFGSDLDVMFVHEPLNSAGERADEANENNATQYALEVANELRRLLSLPAADPPVGIDADLRPEGRSGPLVRSLASYAAYYQRWSLVWEAQALLRARLVAGDEELGQRFLEMVNPHRWKAQGLTADEAREVRRIKARVEAERLPRGADPGMHTKLGRGGLSDIEWTAQLLQLRHAHDNPALQTTGTLSALSAATAAGLMGLDDEVQLRESWLLVSRVRNAIILVRGRADDSLPRDLRELERVARVVGYAAGSSGEFIEDYRRVTRRARTVVERVFYE